MVFAHGWFNPGRVSAELPVFRGNIPMYGLTYFSRVSSSFSPYFSRREGDRKGTIRTLSRQKSSQYTMNERGCNTKVLARSRG